jgi:hypothetical protein
MGWADATNFGMSHGPIHFPKARAWARVSGSAAYGADAVK